MLKKLLVTGAALGFIFAGTVVEVATAEPAQAATCADYPNVNKTWFKRTCL